MDVTLALLLWEQGLGLGCLGDILVGVPRVLDILGAKYVVKGKYRTYLGIKEKKH